MKKVLSSLTLLVLCCLSTNAQIGKNWAEVTKREEGRFRIQLENFKKPSGDNTPFSWPRATAFADKDGKELPSLSADVTTHYHWNPSLNTHTFTLVKFPGNRSEIRIHDNYKTGSRQFEGYFTMNDKLDKQAVFQLFGSAEGATQMQIRGFGNRKGGSLEVTFDTKMPSSGNKVIAADINHKEVRINVIHLQEDVGDAVIVYVDGVEKFRFKDGETLKDGKEFMNYMKFGVYGREQDGEFDGVTHMQTKWRNVRLWEGGQP